MGELIPFLTLAWLLPLGLLIVAEARKQKRIIRLKLIYRFYYVFKVVKNEWG